MLLSALVFAPVVALAQSDGIQIENAWSRAAMQGRIGVVYLTIVDHGAADRLTGVSSPVARESRIAQFLQRRRRVENAPGARRLRWTKASRSSWALAATTSC